jgi:hypothetical protein
MQRKLQSHCKASGDCTQDQTPFPTPPPHTWQIETLDSDLEQYDAHFVVQAHLPLWRIDGYILLSHLAGEIAKPRAIRSRGIGIEAYVHLLRW